MPRVVADRAFVNNVSFGVYAMIVSTEGYREKKPETAWQVLPTVLGPDAGPIDLQFTGPDGRPQNGFQIITVSNDPYHFTADSRFGTRERLDRGVLGIAAARAGKGDDFLAFASGWWAGQRDPSGAWLQWEASEFEMAQRSRSLPGWTARRSCSIRPFGCVACRAHCASVCPPPAARRPPGSASALGRPPLRRRSRWFEGFRKGHLPNDHCWIHDPRLLDGGAVDLEERGALAHLATPDGRTDREADAYRAVAAGQGRRGELDQLATPADRDDDPASHHGVADVTA